MLSILMLTVQEVSDILLRAKAQILIFSKTVSLTRWQEKPSSCEGAGANSSRNSGVHDHISERQMNPYANNR